MSDLPGLDDYDLLVTLKPGDVVVMRRKDGVFRPEQARHIHDMLKATAPDVKWLVLDATVDLTVMRPVEAS